MLPVNAFQPRSKRMLVRRAIITAGLALGILTTGATAAMAQGGDLAPNQTATYATWFWGRTTVCIKNVDAIYDAGYTWSSSTSWGSGGLTPGQENCFTRSFAGFRIAITDSSARAHLNVRFPIGP
jgi:hypothetical protein